MSTMRTLLTTSNFGSTHAKFLFRVPSPLLLSAGDMPMSDMSSSQTLFGTLQEHAPEVIGVETALWTSVCNDRLTPVSVVLSRLFCGDGFSCYFVVLVTTAAVFLRGLCHSKPYSEVLMYAV